MNKIIHKDENKIILEVNGEQKEYENFGEIEVNGGKYVKIERDAAREDLIDDYNMSDLLNDDVEKIYQSYSIAAINSVGENVILMYRFKISDNEQYNFNDSSNIVNIY